MKKEKNIFKIAIEFDDLSVVQPAFTEAIEALEKLRENYPKLKVTFFTTPWEVRFGIKGYLTYVDHKDRLRALQKLHEQGWVEYAVHGLTHLPSEFGLLTADDTKKRMIIAEKLFDEAKLPFVKVFKAPNWALSQEAEKVLIDMDYKVVKDGYYNWNLKDDMPKPQEHGGKLVIAHGHVQNGDGCDNGVCETIHKLRKLPVETEFKFISEIL